MTAADDLSAHLVDLATLPELAAFGDPEQEIAALDAGCGMYWNSASRVVRIGGADRATFLQRLLTADIAGISDGSACPCMLLDVKGRIQALFDLGATGGEFFAIGSAPALNDAMATLRRYVLAADVTIEDAEELAAVHLRGPATNAVVEAAAGQIDGCVLEQDAQSALILTGAPVETWQSLDAAGAIAVGTVASETDRILACRPAHPGEITGAEFPQELGLAGAVDFEKGCYLGQETVARIHYRGGVQRGLATLHIAAQAGVGTEVMGGGRAVGALTSAASRADETVALAVVRLDALDDSAGLTVGDGVEARILAIADPALPDE